MYFYQFTSEDGILMDYGQTDSRVELNALILDAEEKGFNVEWWYNE